MTLLKEWMKQNGVSDQAVAEKIGVSRVQVLRIRSGENRPSVKTAKALEVLTQIDAHKFLMDGA